MIDRIARAVFGDHETPPFPVPAGVAVRRGGLIPALGGLFAGMHGSAAAVTLGRTIVLHPDARITERLLRHELAHVRQWQRRPLSFPWLYLWSHMRYGYRDNPYEIEAREAELAP